MRSDPKPRSTQYFRKPAPHAPGRGNRGYADKAPFAFTGTVKKVVFDIKPHLSADDDQALHESAHHGHVAHGISG